MRWPRVTIDSIKSPEPYSLIGGPFGSNLTSRDYVEGGVPVIRGSNLPEGAKFHDDDFVYVSEEKADQLHANLAFKGDVVITQRGTLGQVGLIPNECRFPRYVLSQSQMKLTVDRSRVIPEYVYYYFRLRDTVEHIRNHDSSSGVPHINLAVLKGMRIPLPPVLDQQRIVEQIAAYDDLIDNNRRRIKLLEDSVRLVFDEWFSRLRSPGYERKAVVDGLPEGWERGTVGGVIRSLEDGDWIESKDQGGDDFRILQISNIGRNEFRETGNFRFITEETFSRLRCREVTPGMILVARMPTPIGRAMMASEMPWRMVTAVDVAIVEPDDERVDRHYLLYHLNSDANLARCEALTVGATRPRVTRRNLAELPLVIPDRATQAAFRELAADVLAQRVTLSRQIEKLTAARDLLLPRLMSGEIEL